MVDQNDKFTELSILYRIILRFPKLSLENFSAEFQGLLWGLILPTSLVCYFWLNLVLLVFLSYPFNYVVVGAIAFLIVMFILRILVERSLNSANAILSDVQFRHGIEEVLQDYLNLCSYGKVGEETEKDETS